MVGYVRVSTREQADSGLGLAAQQRTLADEAARRGWQLVGVEVDAGVSAGARSRPGLERALAAVRSGAADGLVVAKLDRLARSVQAMAELLAESSRRGWALVALDLGVDTATPAGRMVAHVLAALAEWEREVIRQRTREAMAEARPRLAAEGRSLGRPSTIPPEVVERVVREKAAGGTLSGIARQLNAEGVAAGSGQPTWHPATVARVLERAGRRGVTA